MNLMKTAYNSIATAFLRSHACFAIGAAGCLVLSTCVGAADPPRVSRDDAFLGIHFDFHAGEDCDRVGQRTTPKMVESVIDKVQPDYIQID